MSDFEARHRAAIERLTAAFRHYAETCLKIRTKDGSIQPLTLNAAQIYLHGRLQAQIERTGKVRALVLKGRQQGISTYIGGRFYWKSSLNRGKRVFILTHQQDATDNLFGMVDRYHSHCPVLAKPVTGAANAKELYFSKMESGYAVATAGTKAVGRSQTVQMFHGSEVAFWPNAKDHFAGVVQAVPDMPGTEIILESTANGIGGEFHDRWQNAEAGKGDYEAIFIPWHWESAYRRELEPDFVLNDEETEYMRLHGLDHQQMAWRRAKLEELGDPLLFMQEYPAVAAEAFQSTGHDSYIKPEHVLRARKAKLEGIGPLIIGVDPARFGDDGFSIAWRKGRQVSKVERRYKLDNVAGANWVRQIIDNEKPQKVFIDAGGVGSGVVDILKSWGDPYDEIVVGVNFGSAPRTPPEILPDGTPKPGPRNRRAEMWMMSLDWLKDEGGADIPDLDWLQGDACGPAYSYDVNQRLLLEPKEKMRARGLRSPDGWDSIALTFAEPVAFRDPDRDQDRTPFYGAGGWMG